MKTGRHKITIVPAHAEDNGGVSFWKDKTGEERLAGLYIVNQNAWAFAGKNFSAPIVKKISFRNARQNDAE